MMLFAALVYAAARWLRECRALAAVPVEVFRDVCPGCGHTEDDPDAGVVLARMAVHRAAEHTTISEGAS